MDCQDFIFTEKKSFYVLFAAGQMHTWRFTWSVGGGKARGHQWEALCRHVGLYWQ